MKTTLHRLLARALILSSITVSILAINSITVLANKLTVSNMPKIDKLVKIYGLTITDNKVTLQLMSNGCTTTDFFTLHWQKQQLQVIQTKADFCRRIPHKVWLSFSIPKQQSNFTLVNPFAF